MIKKENYYEVLLNCYSGSKVRTFKTLKEVRNYLKDDNNSLFYYPVQEVYNISIIKELIK